MVRLGPETKACPHNEQERGFYQEESASLDTLSRHSPWTRDLEVNLERLALPILMRIGLSYQEPDPAHDSDDSEKKEDKRVNDDMLKDKSETIQGSDEAPSPRNYQQHQPLLSTYFLVLDMELDVLHFVEPVVDLMKRQRLPPPLTLPYVSAGGGAITSNNTATEDASRRNGNIIQNNHMSKKTPRQGCSLCFDQDMQQLRDAMMAPLKFQFNPNEIPFDLCLSALVTECLSQDKAQGIIQDERKVVMIVHEECLPPLPESWTVSSSSSSSAASSTSFKSSYSSTRPSSLIPLAKSHRKTREEQYDQTMVWVLLERCEDMVDSDSPAESDQKSAASIQVKGQDPRRVLAVYNALEQRT
ncbi:hypothetical protein BGZ94_003511, partial [Podila epigama]